MGGNATPEAGSSNPVNFRKEQDQASQRAESSGLPLGSASQIIPGRGLPTP